MTPKAYEFGEFQLDLTQKQLRKNGEIVAIQPKVFDVLRVFLEKNNHLITREELMDAVWGETFVEETNLRFCIHSLRKIIGEDFIETLPKRGYRFNAEVREVVPEEQVNETPAEIPPISPAESSQPVIDTPRLPSKVKAFAIGALVFALALLLAGVVWSTWKKPNDKMSIAVIPFTRIGDQPERSIAVADAVVTQLSKLRDFQIVPVSAVQKFASQDIDLQSAGRELNADAVLTGSFREEGGNIKVSVNLIKTDSGENIWTDSFNIKADEHPETPIAARLARLFSLKFIEYEDEKLAKSQKVSPEALDAYLSARKIWRSRDLGRVSEMINLLDKAIKLEPNWIAAHSAKAEALLVKDYSSTNYDDAEKAARKTLELAPSDPGALTVLARIEWEQNFNFDKAEEHLKAAIQSGPTYANAYSEYGILLALKKKFVQSEEMIRKSLEFEPFSPIFRTHLCQRYYYDRSSRESDPNAAMEECKLTLQMEPEFWLARKQLFWIYVTRKMNAEVAQMLLAPYSEDARQKLPYYDSLKKNDLELFWKTKVNENKKRPKPFSDSVMYIQISDKENALKNLNAAYDAGDFLMSTIEVDPVFDPIRDEPGFQDLLKRLATKNSH